MFDAGGLNIKPTGSMEDMHLDKSGACAVLAAIKQIAEMKLKVKKYKKKINVTCTMAFAENSLSNVSYRPSDIIRSRKGTLLL